jgi:two-component system sensor histidine kinase CpxA
VQDLRDDVKELITVTDDLLAFARAELVRDGPLEAVNLAEIVQRAAGIEGRGGAVIRTEVSADCIVRGRRDALFRAIGNVLRNAVRYAGADGPITAHAARDAERVTLVIEDHGPGVPVDALDRVFAPFYRLDPSRTRKSGGAGLGLAIARSAIEACGGTIAGRNREPRGFEVRITLNVADSAELG